MSPDSYGSYGSIPGSFQSLNNASQHQQTYNLSQLPHPMLSYPTLPTNFSQFPGNSINDHFPTQNFPNCFESNQELDTEGKELFSFGSKL